MKNPSMNDWIQQASNQMKTDPKAVKAAIDAGDYSKLTANISQDDMEKVKAILNDKQKLNEILTSPMGKALLKQLGK